MVKKTGKTVKYLYEGCCIGDEIGELLELAAIVELKPWSTRASMKSGQRPTPNIGLFGFCWILKIRWLLVLALEFEVESQKWIVIGLYWLVNHNLCQEVPDPPIAAVWSCYANMTIRWFLWVGTSVAALTTIRSQQLFYGLHMNIIHVFRCTKRSRTILTRATARRTWNGRVQWCTNTIHDPTSHFKPWKGVLGLIRWAQSPLDRSTEVGYRCWN